MQYVKVVVKAALDAGSGFGADGLGLIQALMNAGADVYLDPTACVPPLSATIAGLLTRRPDGPVDLLIQLTDPGQLEISPSGRSGAYVCVGWTGWECSTLDNVGVRRRGLKKRLAGFDAVLGYDTVSEAALRPYVRADGLGVVQAGFWPEMWPPMQRDWTGERFGFCMVGDLDLGRDPFVAIQAFGELKDEHADFAPAELHLKTRTGGLDAALPAVVPDLYVHDDGWSPDVLRGFYSQQHVMLAPSRGEVKNQAALEFLATGGTVIATNWGGHAQWLSTGYAYPLHFSLAPAADGLPDCLNARVSKEHLKVLMLQTFRRRDEARHKGDLAARVIPSMCSWPAALDRLFTKISDLVPGRGEVLLHQFRRARELTQLGLPVGHA